ncbi:CBU_0592 family membrane protein [Cellulomonas pakistanensis]|uniref:CBU-0592-like domain-containing protein n=1 Tax=Cellulomonas pakistanensis TaxID=992287 RepID=A0A919PD11_9CELL|nr:hypothetical protein [Cellulomonas pakistanensis]GIG38226.1 hypothetical protein Cpa01nite_36070 [Cellulomonas pakistanensis]
MSAFVTALGWVGAVTCLVAYVLVTRGTWAPTSGRYQLANVVSGLFMGLVAASSGVWPSVVTNAVWAVVGAHAVMVVLKARRRRQQEAAERALAAVAEAPVAAVEPVPARAVDLAA